MMSQAKGDAQMDGVDSDPSTHPRGPQQKIQSLPREEAGVHTGSPNGQSPVWTGARIQNNVSHFVTFASKLVFYL